MESLKRPLVIGVTGHRDIHPEVYTSVSHLIECWFDQQIEKHGGPDKLRVLSPLAAGADQLVAEIAIKKGIPLYAPLPFPIERYEEDFNNEEKSSFRKLLQQSDQSFVVPGEHREETHGYIAVGNYVSEHAHFLLALWDGQKEFELPGGTAYVVRCRLNNNSTHHETVWISTSRSTDGITLKPTLSILTKDKYHNL